MPNNTARCGIMATNPAPLHNTSIKPSIDQYTTVSLLKNWIDEGMNEVGNHAPPMALILNINNVPNPFACWRVWENAAINIPSAVHATEAAMMISMRLKKFEKISTWNMSQPNINMKSN